MEEEQIPKAKVVKYPDDYEKSGPLEDPALDVVKPKKKVGSFFRNKYVILNAIVMLGQLWEPLRNWTSENPETSLVIIGGLNAAVNRLFGKNLYGDAPEKKKDDAAK